MRTVFPRFREQQMGIEKELRAAQRRWDAHRLRAVGAGRGTLPSLLRLLRRGLSTLHLSFPYIRSSLL